MLLAMLIALPGSALAASANDAIANRVELTIPDFQQQDNINGSTETDEILSVDDPRNFGCDDNTGDEGLNGSKVGKTLWYSFVAPSEEPLTLSTKLSNFDTVLSVHRITGGFLETEVCNDDIAANQDQSELVLFPDANVRYFVQVGGCCGGATSAQGNVRLSIWPPPDNDLRADALPIAFDRTIDTYTVGAIEQTGELLSCTSGSTTRQYAKTVWYRIAVPALGDVTISAGGLSTVVSLYRADNLQRVKCAFAAGAGETVLKQAVEPRTYLVQVGGVGPDAAAQDGTLHVRAGFVRDTDLDNDGYPSPGGDCNDGNPSIHPGAPSIPGNGVSENCVNDPPIPPDLDRDNDLVNDDIDCNDNNPAISQRAKEIPGNSVDEDCVGGPQDYDRIGASYLYDTRPGHVVRFKYVRVFRIPAGATLRMKCRGKGCKGRKNFKRRFTKRRGRLDLTKRVKQHRLRKGATLEIRVTAPGAIGRVFVIKALADGDSRGSIRCLRPGAKKPIRCRS